jgi:uncharacterized protein YndB with AHSA1/START domain
VQRPRKFIARFSTLTQWQNGSRLTATPQRSITWTRKWAALTKCRSRISPPARVHSFGGTYHELKPNERIRYSDKFDDPNMAGEMQTTITLRKVSCGTELNIVQEGVPAIIPAEACYLGWQESLTLLAKLVEAEIPD